MREKIGQGPKTGRASLRYLAADEFLRRFLQHVLPRGFQKIRHYGFMSPRSRSRFEAVRWLAALHAGEPFVLLAVDPAAPAHRPIRPHCADCGGELHVLAVLRRRGRALFDTSQADALRLPPPVRFARGFRFPEPRSRALPVGGGGCIAGPRHAITTPSDPALRPLHAP